MNRAFTLIELLIVVAIIAVLAAIAVPNFLEAQTRAKVSRVRAELRTIATGLEAYAVDWNHYPPNDGLLSVVPLELTTPVSYLTDAKLVDPFNTLKLNIVTPTGARARYYTYMAIVTYAESLFFESIGRPVPIEAVDDDSYNTGAFEKYGDWRMISRGPDHLYLHEESADGSLGAAAPYAYPAYGSDEPYDPTNGSVSFGNLLRTRKHAVAGFED